MYRLQKFIGKNLKKKSHGISSSKHKESFAKSIKYIESSLASKAGLGPLALLKSTGNIPKKSK